MIEVIEVRTCDLAHDKPRKNADTVLFGLDNDRYAIELCPKDRAALDKIMAEYLPHARRAPANGEAKRGHAARSPADRKRSREIRAWAGSQGIAVTNRGRIPADIIARYNAAH